jgi:hypothetical protein
MGQILSRLEFLTVEDWRQIYWFEVHVHLPFLHRLVYAAQQRAKEEKK